MSRLSVFLIILLATALTKPLSSVASSDPEARWRVQESPRTQTRGIEFQNAGESFRGELTFPAGSEVEGLLVVTHGAGTPAHDAPLYGHLIETLPPLGYAVLTFDRRGAGGSAPITETSNYSLLAEDAAAALNAAAAELALPLERTGFWGLSQGGWIAAEAARISDGVGFVVMVSSPTTTPSQQMRFARENRLTLAGVAGRDIEAVNRAHRTVEAYLRGHVDRHHAQAALDAVNEEPWFELAMISPVAAESPEESGWRLEMDFDPRAVIRRVNAPILAIMGGADPWIDVSRSHADFVSLRDDEGLEIEVAVIPQANHVMAFQEETMGLDPHITAKDAPESAAYFARLAHWLASTLEKR